MAYTAEQRRVQRKLIRRGRRAGATRKEILSALETGAVESNFRNLNYGDSDSKGWRQERQRYYKNPTNLNASIDRYYAETKRERGNYRRPADLAQAVQRSAFPGRYAEHGKEAKAILRSFGGGGGGRSSGRVTKAKYTPGRKESFDAGSFLRSQLGKPVKGRLKNSLARAYLDERLDKGSRYLTPGTPGKVKPAKYVPGKKRGGGAVGQGPVKGLQIKPDKWKGSKRVVYAAARGMPSSSEKRGTVNTASGGVSDHYVGKKSAYARDIPATGAQGERRARAIARRLGIKNYSTGNFNGYTVTIDGRKYRVQILWNVADHYDHVHLGVDRIG